MVDPEPNPPTGQFPKFDTKPQGPVYVNEPWQYLARAADDNSSLTYNVSISSPNGTLTIGPTSGILDWIPETTGTYTITLTADDNTHGVGSQSFDVRVSARNHPPVITSEPTVTTTVGELWSYPVRATDPDGDALRFSLDQNSLDRGLQINRFGRITWSPASVGDFPVTLTVDDGQGETATQTFTLGVNNSSPAITSSPTGPAYVGQQWSYQIQATDPDGHTITFPPLIKPAEWPHGFHFDSSTGLITWTPQDTTPLDIELRVEDGFGGVAGQSFTLQVGAIPPDNGPPRITSLPTTATRANQPYTYQVRAVDPDSDSLTYAFATDVHGHAAAPAGMTISSTGLVQWLPTVLGSYGVIIEVTDEVGQWVRQPFSIEVTAPVNLNDPPQITSTPTGPAVRDRQYTYQATATDPNGDTIVWSLDPDMTVVGDMQLDSATGRFTWTPAAAGQFQIIVIASDGPVGGPQTLFETQTFTLTVLNNAPPVITSAPVQMVDAGSSYLYQVVAQDPNIGDILTLTATGLPAGLSMTVTGNGTAHISGTPTAPGLYNVVLTATDQEGAFHQQPFDLLVRNPHAGSSLNITSSPRDRIQMETEWVFQFAADDTEDDTLTWKLVSGPSGMTVNTAGQLTWTPTAAQLGQHAYTVEVTDGPHGTGGNHTDVKTFAVTVAQTADNGRPDFTTTPPTNLVVGRQYQYAANAIDPDGDTLTFSIVNGPNAMTIHPQTGLVLWKPTTADIGDHRMTVRVVDTFGLGVDQTVNLTVRATNRPPQLHNAPLTSGRVNRLFSWNVDASDPDDDHLSYTVSAVDSNGTPISGVNMGTDGTTVSWTPSTTQTGIYRFTLDITDQIETLRLQWDVVITADTGGGGGSHDADQPPTIISDPIQIAGIDEPYLYDVHATDPDGDTISYSLTSAPPGMTIDAATGVITWPNPSAIGDMHWVTVRATANSAWSQQRFALQIKAANRPPVITSQPPPLATKGSIYQYHVTATDADNDPIQYRLLQSPAGMTIDDIGRITWDTANVARGNYIVEIQVSDNRPHGIVTQGPFTLSVVADTAPPKIVILPVDDHGDPSDNVFEINKSFKVVVDAVDDVAVARTQLWLDGNPVELKNGIATLTLPSVGSYVLTASAWDTADPQNQGSATAVTISTFDPTDQQYPLVSIHTPSGNRTLWEPADVLGSVSDANLVNASDLQWTVSVTPRDGGRTRVIGSGFGEVTAGLLGNLDTTVLANGAYILELSATDAGNNTSTDTEVIYVDGNYKPGRFTVSFTDLEIPVAGIPITITRTYDSLEADQQHDFGYGWRMDLSNTKVRTIEVPDVDPGLTGYRPFVDGTRVIMTLPDGSEEGFTFYGKPGTVLFGNVLDYIPAFIPDVGVKSELIVDGFILRKEHSTGEYYDTASARTYSAEDPYFGGSYQLNLRNGNELAINAQTGDLASITDRNGNQLRFTGDGIFHDSGRGIRFERDWQGRITAIIDPSGNRLTYEYNQVTGDLTKFTSRIGAETSFTYHTDPRYPDHFLDQIIDPLGRSAARTEYDEAGRVIRVTDADGKIIETDYSISGRLTGSGIEATTPRLQKLTDQLGNVSYVVFDARGNVIREEDPVGGIVTRTFDAEDMLLTETLVIGLEDSDANGETDDQTTTYVYDTDGNLLSSTDARGLTTRSSFNDFGQPTSQTDVFGNTTSTSYDHRGLPVSIRDANGNVTRLKFDDRGNPTEIRDDNSNLLVSNTYNRFGEVLTSTSISGQTIHFEYDDNGNQVATWRTEVRPDGVPVRLLTETVYDAEGKVTGTFQKEILNPDSQNPTETTISFNTTTYDLVGQVSGNSDQFHNAGETVYDIRGQQIESRRKATNEAGETVWMLSRTVYDAAGRAISTTDSFEEGTTEPVQGTRNHYDAAGRIVKTERLDSIQVAITGTASALSSSVTDTGSVISTRSTSYDSAGRTLSSTDDYNNISITTYNEYGDATQTRTQVKDETGSVVWRVSRTAYDEFGRAVVSTDSYLDATGTTAASPPVYGSRTLYDSQGRSVGSQRLKDVIITLDPATGETTLSHPGTVVHETRTIYDRDGRIHQSISSTGATTTYEYDSLGRQVATIGHPLPIADVGTSAGTNIPAAANTVALRSETVYNARGQVEKQRTNIRQFDTGDIDDSDVQEMAYEYDHKGQTIKTISQPGQPHESFVTSEYDDFGRTIAETNQLGLTRTFTYNDQGQLTAVTLPAIPNPDNGGQLTHPVYRYSYDAQGNMVQLTDPLGRDTRFTFNSRGQQLSRTLPLGFGADGMFGTTDDFGPDLKPNTGDEPVLPEGDFTEHMAYDVRGRQTVHISFEGIVTEYVYDDSDHGNGRLKEKLFYTNQHDYDNGLIRESQSMTYDAFGREIRVVWNRDVSQTDGAAIDTWTREYDPQGRVIFEKSPQGILGYGYDDLGRMSHTAVYESSTAVSAVNPPPLTTAERVTHYGYDILGRLVSVQEDITPANTTDATQDTAYTFDLQGRMVTATTSSLAPAGGEGQGEGAVVTSKYDYDALGRLDTQTDTDAAGNILAAYDYEVRADGKRTALEETFWFDANEDGIQTADELKTTTYNWTYDDVGRLTDEVLDHWDNSIDRAEHFEYDLTGNRTKLATDLNLNGIIDDLVTYHYDANDRLITELLDTGNNGSTDQTTAYTYDQTQQTEKLVTRSVSEGQQSVSRQTFNYNLQGRMNAVINDGFDATGTLNARERTSYTYDSRSYRINLTTEDGTSLSSDLTTENWQLKTETKFLAAHSNHTGYTQTIRETTTNADGTTKTIDYTFGHDEISQRVVERDTNGTITSDETHIFGHDGHGSVRMLTDLAGTIAQVFTFSSYGVMLAVHNSAGLSSPLASRLSSLGYSGEHFDAKAQQQYLRARFYNPANGRFNRLDPFAGNNTDPQSFHKYLYTHADPVNGVDPSGLLLSASIARISIGVLLFGPPAAMLGFMASAWFFRGTTTYQTPAGTITTKQLRLDYLDSVAHARRFYRSADPQLFDAMQLDNLFDELEWGSRGVKAISVSPVFLANLGAGAGYNRPFETLVLDRADYFQRLNDSYTGIGSDGGYSKLLHETVHSVTHHRQLTSDERTDEAYAYGTEYVLSAFLRLVEFKHSESANFPSAAIRPWYEFWDNHESESLTRVYTGSGRSDFTQADLQRLINWSHIKFDRSSD